MTYTRDRETHRERGTQRETERDTHTYTEKGGSNEIHLEEGVHLGGWCGRGREKEDDGHTYPGAPELVRS